MHPYSKYHHFFIGVQKYQCPLMGFTTLFYCTALLMQLLCTVKHAQVSISCQANPFIATDRANLLPKCNPCVNDLGVVVLQKTDLVLIFHRRRVFARASNSDQLSKNRPS